MEIGPIIVSAHNSPRHQFPGRWGSVLVAILSTLVKVVVLADELLQLALNVDDLVGGELELHDGNAGILEILEEADFVGEEEHERAALCVGATGGTTDSVDVVAGVIRGIELDDPVDGGNLASRQYHDIAGS